MELERKTLTFKVRDADADDGTLRFAGLGSVFGNTDLGGDIVMPGAFAESLKERRPKMLMHHGFGASGMTPVGSWTAVKETDDGLDMKGELFLETEDTRLAARAIRAGEMDGLSIGFIPTAIKWDDDEPETRFIERVELMEVSIVTFPMNPEATITAVKARAAEGRITAKELERILRDVGFSRTDAKAIVGRGLSAVQQRDVAESDSIHELFSQLTGAIRNGCERTQGQP